MASLSDFNRLSGRILLKGQLRLESPLIIGGGNNLWSSSDLVVLKDKENQPYIPGTSLTGAIRDYFEQFEYNKEDNENKSDQSIFEIFKALFWGTDSFDKSKINTNNLPDELKKILPIIEEGCQSALIINDATLTEGETAKISVRDGIKINSASGITEDEHKFDYEVVEAGTRFDLNMEVNIRQIKGEKRFFLEFMTWIKKSLEGEKVFIGAKTGQGFGKCQLIDANIHHFDYSQANHVIAWLSGDIEKCKIEQKDLPKLDKLFKVKGKNLIISANFALAAPLIVGSYPGDPQAPDKVHIKGRNSAGEEVAILPGTSMRGAIRARAEKIVNSLGVDKGEDLLRDLFGYVDNEKKSSNQQVKPIKGRIRVAEKTLNLENCVEEIQHRIRIDRFTGGVMDGGLFDSMPIWLSGDSIANLTLEIEVKGYKDWEAGLLFLVLKDMWTGDLAIGGEKNVGRGILKGLDATITIDDEKIMMEEDANGQLFIYEEGKKPTYDKDLADFMEDKVVALGNKVNGNEGGGL